MTSTSRRPPSNGRTSADGAGADPWWGFDDVPVAAGFDEPVAVQRTAPREGRRRRRRQRSGAGRVGWLLLGVLVAPLDLVRRLLAASPRLRRWAIRLAVVLGVLTVLACSVGVILINNVVIGRSAELGELDDARRELRRENALLSARAARLSSPDVVFRRATRELGMVSTDDVPQFIYLVPGSRTLTPWQRRRVAARVQMQQARAARAAASAIGGGGATSATDTPAAPDATDTTDAPAPTTPAAPATKGDR